jgi:hypothetical protein
MDLQQLIAQAVAQAVAQATAATAQEPKPKKKKAASAASSDQDATILNILEETKGPQRPDGRPSGSLAVKVHSYLHACGIPKDQTRNIIDSAIQRGVIERMVVRTKGGKYMALYFPAGSGITGFQPVTVDQAKAAKVKAALLR